MPKRLSPSELTKLIDSTLKTIDPKAVAFSPYQQGIPSFREYSIEQKTIRVSSPVHDLTRTTFRELHLTTDMPSLEDLLKAVPTMPTDQDLFIPLAECRNNRRHWVLLVRQINGEWHFYDPKPARWGCGLFNCIKYNCDHLDSLIKNGINYHYTGLQSAFNGEICGHVLTHLIKSLALGQNLKETAQNFKIENYLIETTEAAEDEALMGLAPNSYGTAVVEVGAVDSDEEDATTTCCCFS